MSTWPNWGPPAAPAGGWNNESPNSQKKSDHAGLTQANRPPRKPVRFNTCLQILSVSVFEKTEVTCALQPDRSTPKPPDPANN